MGRLHQVVLANSAIKELAKLPRGAQLRIVEALDGLQANPRPHGAEKLQSNPSFMRMRTGDYRIIYAIEDNPPLCVVVVIRDRKDAFKGLGSLDAKLAKTVADIADRLRDQSTIVGTA